MTLKGSVGIHESSPIVPILGRINPVPRIDTYSFNIYILMLFSHLGLDIPKDF